MVDELAGPLPLQVICDMMGIPERRHDRIFRWTNVILGFGDPDSTTDFDEFVKARNGYRRVRARHWPRTGAPNPGDDLTTAWCTPRSTANG